ncbi:MAG: hypothetical protein PHP00_05700 [Thiotrichaceae bacterium]|nr:hypothetical protein [Thiotrichaceae bacterium]
MSTSSSPFSIANIENLSTEIPGFENLNQRVIAPHLSYERFVAAIYRDINKCIGLMEDDVNRRQKDSEDRLTIELKNYLSIMGNEIAHGTNCGGSVDLLITYPNTNWRWVGECKRFCIGSQYEKLFQGFQQLSQRYQSGKPENADRGALLIYIFFTTADNNVRVVMEKWEADLFELWCEQHPDKPPLEILERSKDNPLIFDSVHEHHSSGMPFHVRHIPINLIHNPKDYKK